jgi:hypothetical protein
MIRGRDLREKMRDRFRWTLQPDPRYEVVAYRVAYESMSDERVMDSGLDVSWILKESLEWRQEGFRDNATEDTLPLLAMAVTPAMLAAGWAIIMTDPVYGVVVVSCRIGLIPDELWEQGSQAGAMTPSWTLRRVCTQPQV